MTTYMLSNSYTNIAVQKQVFKDGLNIQKF